MSDKFNLYQTDGLWGIIENASNEKQTSIKSYFGSDLIIKRLNEQADQIDQLKQQLTEKDKEIAYLKEIRILKDNSNMSTKINGVDFSDEQILTLQVLDILKRYNQKELAIRELEKVKALLFSKAMQITGTGVDCVRLYVIDKTIDQQIKELKGEKDVKD